METTATLPVRGVLFDLDGTITRPVLDFNEIRQAIGVRDGIPILEYMEELGPAEQERAHAILDRFEVDAAENAVPNQGVLELFRFLDDSRIKTAIVTRNSRKSARITLEKLGLSVGAMVCREDAAPKPSAEPALLAARSIHVPSDHCLFVGDYEFDVLTGIAAGMRTVLIPSRQPPERMPAPDYELSSALELIQVIRKVNGL